MIHRLIGLLFYQRAPHSNRKRTFLKIPSTACLLLVTVLLAACQGQTLALVRAGTRPAPTGLIASLTPSIVPLQGHTPTPDRQASSSPSVVSALRTATRTSPQPPTYIVQSGDSLAIIARRFNIQPQEITSPEPLSGSGMLAPGQMLWLPARLTYFSPGQRLLPDSEVVYSPSALDFNTAQYLETTRGALKVHREYLQSTGWTSAADIVERVALENSINPRLLLALLEYQCHCVAGGETRALKGDYVLGVEDFHRKGLYGQLWWAANQLSTGYYGWREGWLFDISLPNGAIFHIAPDSNAGSVALQVYFASLWAAYDMSDKFGPQTWATRHPAVFGEQEWQQALEPGGGFSAFYQPMFGDAWERAQAIEPLLPAGLTQPALLLPFEPGRVWSFASGPHRVWENEGSRSALDFAPATDQSGCTPSDAWVTAAADGPVVRMGPGLVVQDLDGEQPADRREQTGWSILYVHVAASAIIQPGVYLKAGDPIGHPACIGGPTLGTHLHIARKYNGEWIAAGGPLPFVMSGWTTQDGDKPYAGTLTRDGQTVVAQPNGAAKTLISRAEDIPTPTPTQSPAPK
jgi:LasA protease